MRLHDGQESSIPRYEIESRGLAEFVINGDWIELGNLLDLLPGRRLTANQKLARLTSDAISSHLISSLPTL